MSSIPPSQPAPPATTTNPGDTAPPDTRAGGRWAAAEKLAPAIVLGAAVLLWVPRYAGPIDLRWDGGVYYILGTSLSEGKGYKLLNEPGEIDAVQYPPLLPAIVAAHQLALGTSDPTTVGRWLRLSSFLMFLAYAVVVLRFLRSYLPPTQMLLGALVSVFCLHAWFLSDALFPEVWFSVATVLFLILARKRESTRHAALAYLCALASYALRTIGVAAFVVWVVDSLIRRRFREALVRGLLALVPVLAWQSYIASIERSESYTHPAYAYQRAPYMFYNVSYARNIVLRDPFTPEKGSVRMVRRVVRNALEAPVHLGEALTVPSGYLEMGLHAIFGEGRVARPLADWSVFLVLAVGGALLVAGGLLVLLVRAEWIVPVYLLVYMAALLVTPFPAQSLRYLMPVTPLIVLLALRFLGTLTPRSPGVPTPRWRRILLSPPFAVLGPALLVQMIVTGVVFAREYQRIEYVDLKGERLAYRLFFYDEAKRGFDQVVEYVRAHALPKDIVAAGTPHWIYLRTGLTTVMPPLEHDPELAERLLDSVPVEYLVIGLDVVATERYTVPVVQRFHERWDPVYATPAGGWTVYRRVRR